MSIEFTHSQIIERLPAYVLGALEPDELLAVEDYLSQHEEVMAQLQTAEQAITHLAHAAPQVPLPAGAKAQLMAPRIAPR